MEDTIQAPQKKVNYMILLNSFKKLRPPFLSCCKLFLNGSRAIKTSRPQEIFSSEQIKVRDIYSISIMDNQNILIAGEDKDNNTKMSGSKSKRLNLQMLTIDGAPIPYQQLFIEGVIAYSRQGNYEVFLCKDGKIRIKKEEIDKKLTAPDEFQLHYFISNLSNNCSSSLLQRLQEYRSVSK